MIIVGAGGFASELVQIIPDQELFFFDNVTLPCPDRFLDRYPIISSEQELTELFKKNNQFSLGIGRPEYRESLTAYIEKLGGKLTSIISENCTIGKINVSIGNGTTILDGVRISNNVSIGKGVLIYYNAVITHDCVIGNFCELSPGATLLGHVHVGNGTHIGANATLLPGVKIGKNCIVGAGAVVTKDVPDNSIAIGIPATIKTRETK